MTARLSTTMPYQRPEPPRDAPGEALRRFVRERRLRVGPESHFLGKSPRWPARIGKRVTQEELAEHLGITRQWCARFEAGAPVRFSAALLGRLGDVLMLSAAERAELIRLARPELARAVSRNSTVLYEVLRDVRQTVKRLWRATTETEIFHVAGEAARGLLPRFDAIYAQRGVLSALEDAVVFRNPGVNLADYGEFREDLIRRLTPELIARVDAAWQCSAAGDLLPFEAYPADFVRPFRFVLRQYGVAWESLLTAHVRGPSGSLGLVGGVSSLPHDVTELERTQLSAIAEFASLALR